MLTDYTYNTLDQLTQIADGSPTGTQIASYSYDVRGNLDSATENGITTDYTYNARNLLASVGQMSYTYDHNGRRITENDGSAITNLLWDEFSTYGDVLAETDGSSGALLTRYFIGEELIGQVRWTADSPPQAEVGFYLEDTLGSTRLLVDNIGNTVDTFEYDAYGQLTAGNASATDYLYTGQQFDATTGHDHR